MFKCLLLIISLFVFSFGDEYKNEWNCIFNANKSIHSKLVLKYFNVNGDYCSDTCKAIFTNKNLKAVKIISNDIHIVLMNIEIDKVIFIDEN